MRSLSLLLVIAVVSCTKKEISPPEAVLPVPTDAQIAWHKMEQNAFIHFTINTFTDKEWGYGDEKEALFNPTSLNTTQWAKTLKSAGFNGVILTCKHHDGFCLWPSAYTEHSIKNSPYKNGKGDLVKELSSAVRAQGMKFGVYVSPWDRNRADYGTQDYVDVYRLQLKELFTSYGPMFEMWFDGANGGDGYYGGAREKRKIDGARYYDWPVTLAGVRKIQSDVIFFSDAGPGVRWVGNEKGVAGETNWNNITPDTLYAGKAGIEKLLGTGSENGTNWIPAEVDVSIRPGWFYHEKEDDQVKTPEQLFDIYLSSVGRGATLLLNVPPDRRGLIAKKDSVALQTFHQLVEDAFKKNLVTDGSTKSDSYRGSSEKFSAQKLIDSDVETYWATDDEVKTGVIELSLKENSTVRYIVLEEYIKLGQRIKRFRIDARRGDKWVPVGQGTTIGYKRIIKIDPVETSVIRITILESKASPVISEIGVY